MRPTNHHDHGPCDHDHGGNDIKYDNDPVDHFIVHDGAVVVYHNGPRYDSGLTYDAAIDRLLDHIGVHHLIDSLDRRGALKHDDMSGVVDEQRDVPAHDCLERLRDAANEYPGDAWIGRIVDRAIAARDGLPDGG